MLYPKNVGPALSGALFRNPSAEYRGTPFWSWNCKLDKDLLMREIGQIKEMGMGGFHIHCRSGLATEYLGEEFMTLVRAADEKAKREKMLCWLYDEDRWPSGFAGGIVTKDHRYRARFLVFEPRGTQHAEDDGNECSGRAKRSPESTHLAAYAVRLEDGFLAEYRRLAENETPSPDDGTAVWDAYLEVNGDSSWFNNQAYVNTLDPAAIRRFAEVTHEKYFQCLGKEFGKSVPAIFTDEPQFTLKDCLRFAGERRPVTLPFTDDFDDTYRAAYGESILDRLPELIWELPDGRVSAARYRYHDHLSERFASAFADTLGTWCAEHGLMLTGHMMEEDTLWSQTRALGDCMRSYRAFQLPGIDMLCDGRNFATAKQAASAAHQYGRPGVLSELYGVSNWDFDFRRYKLAGDWQAALGVTVRVPHLNWVSMEGEAKRDYPAPIGYQSTWYREFPLVENHFARLNTALTRGKPHVRLAVVHPVESYWLHWGPNEQTELARDELETNHRNLTEWLLGGLVDFDFLAESLLPAQMPALPDGKTFDVGEMHYDAVLVPGCETLRATTLERLAAFHRAGGRVIFAGEPARLIDAQPDDSALRLAAQCECVPFSRRAILEAAEPLRDVDVRSEGGARAGNLLYQMRQDGENRWLFLCRAHKTENMDITWPDDGTICIRGEWKPTVYDTMTGKIHDCPAAAEHGETRIPCRFFPQDSLLLLLEPTEKAEAARTVEPRRPDGPLPHGLHPVLLPEPSAFRLSEPNVLVLDTAEYSFDGGTWRPTEEILRIGNLFRAALGYPPQNGGFAQPWSMPAQSAEKQPHTLSLRFSVRSEIALPCVHLALERPAETQLTVNGRSVPTDSDGWFTDESIRTVPLPTLPAGTSEIVVRIPFTRCTTTEWCYLLGEFGVRAAGRFATVTAPPESLVFGDWTVQGLPFYAGNVTYRSKFACAKRGHVFLEAAHFRAPLLTIAVDGQEKGKIAFSPYIADLGVLETGAHTVEITAFGSRVNAFGALHNTEETVPFVNTESWRTDGVRWCYEYRLRPQGVLVTPTIWIK